MGIEFTTEKTAFLEEHWVAYGKSNRLGIRDRFLEEFFAAWLTHFPEMEYLEADSDVQVFVKRRMIKALHERFRAIIEDKATRAEELAKLKAPWRGVKLEIRKATVKVEKGPRRFNPFRASTEPGTLGMQFELEQRFKTRSRTSDTMPPSVLDSMPSMIRRPAGNRKPR
ncbi:hypothetical protein EYR36_003429 [Pleurotus pulmonarius]|nr:hypothetical protein EYR36_003429 [Pleurotus pulmonarius]